ncbi:hypothetical protein [Bradyrhizobium sp. ORS 111]|uniref:hypothetical protein n=1 Tax=Bradyrhizobium sp. ORS 111 TaxID=1685958 RepID=UPI00388D7D10
MKIIVRTVAIIAVTSLCACVKVPANEGASDVRFNEVVKRVKCEVVYAIGRKLDEDRHRFGFLSQWSAKVHMTLIVDDTATVNPGVSVVSPLSVAGTTFTFGAGGSFSGQATRQEDYEFFLSFPTAIDELTRNPERTSVAYDDCRFQPGLLLESSLGIDSILERAVSPIRAGTLYTGHQVGPGSSSSPAVPANEAANINTAFNELKKLAKPEDTDAKKLVTSAAAPAQKNFMIVLDHVPGQFQLQAQSQRNPIQFLDDKKDEVARAIKNAPKFEHDTQLVIKTVVTPVYDLANTIKLPAKCLSDMLSNQITAVGKNAEVTINKVKIDEEIANAKPGDANPNGDPVKILDYYGKETTAKNAAFAAADAMLKSLNTCKIPPAKPLGPVQPLYDPIDLIQETVNFYITTSGNITPSWKLVRVTAPTASPFLSGQIKNTDTIIITMGRPVEENGKIVASTPMILSQQAALLSQAINQRLVP